MQKQTSCFVTFSQLVVLVDKQSHFNQIEMFYFSGEAFTFFMSEERGKILLKT